MAIEKDEEFYMNFVTIQVENRLFRVPRQTLESESEVFRDMFSLPETENAEGSSDDNPIRLEGIGKDEFKRFLEVLFMGYCKETTKTGPLFETWFPIVKLAKMWGCDGIYKYAMKNMPYRRVCKSAAEKVALAVKHDIGCWLLLGVNELANRKEPLGMSDFEHLGPELTLKVAAIRESFTVDIYNRVVPTAKRRDNSNADFTSIIKQIFHVSDGADGVPANEME